MDLSNLSRQLQELASQAAQAADAESVTIRHAGLTVRVPFEEAKGKTVLQLVRERASELAIPAGARPNVTRPGQGVVDVEDEIDEPGEYDLYTDKKENA